MENYNKKLFDRFLAGIAAVNVRTHDEYDQFMRVLEKETNLKWSLGEKPTHFYGWTSNEEKTCIRRVANSDTILFGGTSYYESKGYEIIEFSDLMKKENNMKFKVGDKVRVRSWGSMKEEFGLDGDGDILTTKTYFLGTMRKYCGKVLTISEVDTEHEVYGLEGCNEYDFDDDMLEPAKKERRGLLDDVDREYLSNIVAPQGIYGKVPYVIKHYMGGYTEKRYFLEIEIESTVCDDSIILPSFSTKAHMYEGMVPEKLYTLAQLGIKRKKVK